MKDNRGFMITGILYSMLILFSIIVLGLLSVMATRKNMLHKLSTEMVDAMGATRGEYRYVMENGTFSEWNSYVNVTELNHQYPLIAINHTGTENHLFKLYGNHVTMQIGSSNSGIHFNGTDSYAKSEAELVFDGTNTYIEIPVAIPDTLTIEVWAYANSFDAKMLWSFDNGYGPDLYFKDNKIALNQNDDMNNAYSGVTAYPSVNTWHHYAVTFDKVNNVSSLYIDGVFVGTATYKAPTGNKLFIGSFNQTGTSYRFNGMIRDVRVWNKVLSADTIASRMYQTLSGTEEALLTYHPLRFNSGTQATAVKGNHGVITSGSWVESNTNSITYRTIYLDFTASKCDSTIMSFDNLDKSLALNDQCQFVMTTNGTQNKSTSAYRYPIGKRVQLVLMWNGSYYDFYLAGSKYIPTSSASPASLLSFEHMALGYHEKNNNQFFSGTIHALYMSENAITEASAVKLSTGVTPVTILSSSALKYDYTGYIHIR